MNIMASLSLESSLHALVKVGSPMGTNLNPGGGFESFVTCHDQLDGGAGYIDTTTHLELEPLLFLFGIFCKFKVGVIFRAVLGGL